MVQQRRQVRVCIVGSGASGICAAIQLRQRLGLETFTLYEKSHQEAGTWEANTYPGCACDVPSHWYSLSTELNPDWSHSYSAQPEIKAYWAAVFAKHNLAAKTKFSTLFVGAEWREAEQNYLVEFKDLQTGKSWSEEFEVFISAMGGLSVPMDKPAGMTGIDDFKGDTFHSARWRHDISLAGKKVAVIGNGCSASQFIPIIAEDSTSEIMNFVRTPNYYMPRPQVKFSSFTKWSFRNIPGLMRSYRNFIAITSDLRFVVWQLNFAPLRHYVEEVSIKHITSQTPEKYHSFLTPRYPFGCKRVIMDPGYLASLNRSNVDMITDPIATITPNGLRGKSGKEYEFDVLILATGFVIGAGEDGLNIKGRDGQTMTEQWRKQGGAQAYLSTCVANFPNFFALLGPNAASGFASAVYAIEGSVEMMIKLVEPMVFDGVTSMEVKIDHEKAYNEQLHARLAKTVWNGGCNSWYVQGGKNVASYPTMVTELVRKMANPPMEAFIQIGGRKRLALSKRIGQVAKIAVFVAFVFAVRHVGFEQLKGQALLFVLSRVVELRGLIAGLRA